MRSLAGEEIVGGQAVRWRFVEESGARRVGRATSPDQPSPRFVEESGAWGVGHAASPPTDEVAIRAAATLATGQRDEDHRVATKGRQGNQPGLSEPSVNQAPELEIKAREPFSFLGFLCESLWRLVLH